MEGTITSCCTR